MVITRVVVNFDISELTEEELWDLYFGVDFQRWVQMMENDPRWIDELENDPQEEANMEIS